MLMLIGIAVDDAEYVTSAITAMEGNFVTEWISAMERYLPSEVNEKSTYNTGVTVIVIIVIKMYVIDMLTIIIIIIVIGALMSNVVLIITIAIMPIIHQFQCLDEIETCIIIMIIVVISPATSSSSSKSKRNCSFSAANESARVSVSTTAKLDPWDTAHALSLNGLALTQLAENDSTFSMTATMLLLSSRRRADITILPPLPLAPPVSTVHNRLHIIRKRLAINIQQMQRQKDDYEHLPVTAENFISIMGKS